MYQNEISSKDSVLSKSDLRKAWMRWLYFSHLTYNYQRMMGGAFASMMGPLLKKLYPNNKDEVANGLKRNLLFFNTEPSWGAVIPGLTVALEEQRAKEPSSVADDTIINLKSSLMGPLAGIGDTLSQALFTPILLSICLGWASNGSLLGPLVFGLGYFLYCNLVTSYTFNAGYRLGTAAVEKFLYSGVIDKVTTATSIMGLMVAGSMVCKFISVGFTLQFSIGDTALHLGEIVDMLVPKLLPLIVTWTSYKALEKGVSVVKILLTLTLIALIGGSLGILG